MLASRTLFYTTRAVRVQPFIRTVRFQSTTASSSQSQGGASSALVGGLAGGAIALVGGYSWYHFSGAKTVVNAAHSVKSKFDAAVKKSTEQAPAPNEALQWLRETTTSYAAFIPGAKGYVNSAFDDLDAVHKKHGDEVDKIVKDAYNELKDVSKQGASIDTVTKAWDVLQTHLKRIGNLAGDAADDILSNHPEIKKKVGGNLDQLKLMGDQYGPEAKKKAEETWGQVQDIVKGGIGIGTADQIRKLVQEKLQELRKYGDQAWEKGLEQAKPYLDKSPELKEMVEKNKDKLMQGDLSQLWDKVQAAAKSGDLGDLEKFVKDTAGKAKDQAGGSGGMEQYLKMIPGGEQILPKLSQLQEIAQKHGDEAEKLAKDAIKDIQDVLSKKVDEAEKLANKAQKDAKK